MSGKFRNWMFTAQRINSKLEATELTEERKEKALDFLLANALEKLDNQTPEEFLEFLLDCGWTREDLGLEENASMSYTVKGELNDQT